MTIEDLYAHIKEQFGDSVDNLDSVDPARPALLRGFFVASDDLPRICQYMSDEPTLKLDYLNCITATDFGDSIHVAYVLTSLTHHHQVAVKVKLSRENPVVGTVERTYGTANWHEREAYDLLGVRFEGHSDMRRLLMPDDWEGYPLRKDYQEQPTYHGIPTTRDNPLGKV